MGKKVLSVLLVLTICIGLLPGVSILTHAVESATDMSEWVKAEYPELTEKVLTINDAEDFKLFQLELCKYGKTFVGYTIYLTADLDLNPEWNSTVSLTWENGKLTEASVQQATAPDQSAGGYHMPAVDTTNNASKAKQFGGVFDGQGHTISGLYLSLNAGNAASLFGQVIGTATVKNLAVLDSYFANGGTNLTDSKPLAGVFTNVPTGTSATISNCYVDIDLYEKSTAKSTVTSNLHAKFGGLVGYCAGTLTIEDTVYAGSMSFNPSTSTGKRLDNAAGFIGLVYGVANVAANVTVRNSIFAGTVWSPYQRVAGGIARSQGVANVTMTNCLHLGRIYGASTNNATFMASILIQNVDANNPGKQSVTMTDCYLRQTDSPRLVYTAGTHNGNCSITATVNGEQKYTLGMSSTTETGYNDASFRIFTSAQADLTAQAVLESKPIGGNGGKMSDVFTATAGAVMPKTVYEMLSANEQFQATAPVITTNPTGKAYDKNDVAAALSAAATGEGTLSYQWYCGDNAIEGATGATYTPSTTTAGNFAYRCVVTATQTNFLGTVTAEATSSTAIVHVHDWTLGTCTNPKTCNIADCPTIVDAADHVFDDDCTTADQCANCTEKATANESHSFDADCTTADQCANCKKVATANANHTYSDDHDTSCNEEGCTGTRDAIHTESTDWSKDEKNHWHICTGCDYAFTETPHVDSETDVDEICDECGYDMTCRHTNLTEVKGSAPTCTQDGTAHYWECNDCGARLSAEVDGTELGDEGTIIPAQHTGISNRYSSDKTNHWKVCTDCNAKLYVSAHVYSDAEDTSCDCGHKRTLVPTSEMITVSKWVEAGYPEAVKHVTITNMDDFKAFMKVLKEGTTAVLNSSWEIKTEGDIAFDGMTIYLTTDLDLNPGWFNDFSMNWNPAGSLVGNLKVTVPGTKYNVYPHRIFGGMFEGMGHTISGLYIDQEKSAAAQSFLGVAHSTSGFTVGVQNLTIKNSYIEGTNAGMGALFTGVTAGTNVLISKCNIDVDLVSRFEGADKTSIYVGGLIGTVAGNVTVHSTAYHGNIWIENTKKLDYREIGGIIGGIKGGKTAGAETHVIINKCIYNGKIYCVNGQRVSVFAGRIDNQTNVAFVDSLSTGSLVLMNGVYTGGFCNNIVAAASGVTTKVLIDNCYFVPGVMCKDGKLEQQTEIFTALHNGSGKSVYGGFGKVISNTSAKGTCIVYVVSDKGTDWSDNLCLYTGGENPTTADMAGMYLGYAFAIMLISAMALVVLIPKKFYKK